MNRRELLTAGIAAAAFGAGATVATAADAAVKMVGREDFQVAFLSATDKWEAAGRPAHLAVERRVDTVFNVRDGWVHGVRPKGYRSMLFIGGKPVSWTCDDWEGNAPIPMNYPVGPADYRTLPRRHWPDGWGA